MNWDNPLIEATMIKRYKRFLADVSHEGKTLTVHVPNTGSMESCWLPDWKCALSVSNNPNRKLSHTLELIHNGTSWIGVNTGNANKLAKLWLTQNLIPEVSGYKSIIPEKKIGQSRVDFHLENHDHHPPCYIEVKNVTLKVGPKAQFPDSVSERAQKHLKELIEIKKSGLRSAMLFIVQREDVKSFSPATHIDPEYGKLLKLAYQEGVEILVYGCKMGINTLGLKGPLKWELE